MKYPTIHIEGAILSGDILDRLADGDLRGQKPADFGLDSPVKDEIARAWADVQDTWRIYQRRLERLKETDRGTTETRNQWIVPLLGLLGYKLEYQQRGDTVDGRTYALSHRDKSRGGFPVHIMGHRDSLDRKREDGGPRMSPHALVQEYLNLTEHLYAIVTNGRQLRLLRDSTRLVKLSYIEFDLEQMVEEGHFADFAVLFRILHATRMPVSQDDAAESLIEQYHQDALDSGSRIRDGLSKAVERSIIAFANGFLRHPDNEALLEVIRTGELDARTYYQYQLRLIYRLLFLMVIEERNLVYPDGSDRSKRDIYEQYYSVSNLRRLATKRHLADSRHKDYWMALRNTFRLFEHEQYGAPLGIKPLAGDLFSSDAIRHLNICSLDNSVLVACLSNLSVFEHPETHQRIRVNYAALNVEEFGSVYEGLLEYDAQISQSNGKFTFAFVKGSDRASSGSHYTPDELVTPLIRNSLDHVIKRKLEEAEKGQPRNTRKDTKGDSVSCNFVPFVVEQKEQALLSIKVCDVACGSGHILLNAARRIATELAIVRTGEEQPSPKALREAVRDVIRHCIYGVDLNPMAVELCKVALWLESHNPNAPLGFLDHHIKCGNAIVGLAHADELERGIPDEAFKSLPDDDKDVCARLRKNNKAQRKDRAAGQQVNYGERVGRDLRTVLDALTAVDAMPESTPEEVAAKQVAYDKWKSSIDRRNLKIVADLQVAQFFIPKTPEMEARVVTDETYFRHLKGELQLAGPTVAEAMAEANKRDNKFFHWFLGFPEVFATGGFDCILGNPPYLGDKKLRAAFGPSFVAYANSSFAPGSGCDLITYFLRRIYGVLNEGAILAVVTTNSISEGATRDCGLGVVAGSGGTVNFAHKSIRWPGRAAVVVSLVSIVKGPWDLPRFIGTRRVDEISAYLEEGNELVAPFALASNERLSFIGNYVLGDGFLLAPDEAKAILKTSPEEEDALTPYLIGEDLNSSPNFAASRWVINLRELPLKSLSATEWELLSAKEKRERLSAGFAPPDHNMPLAVDYPTCLSILEARAKPARQDCGDRRARLRWWLHARSRPELYDSIAGMTRVLVHTRVTKTHAFAFVTTSQTIGDAVVVFALDSCAAFAAMQSSLHEAWAWKYASRLKTDRRYSPTQCFENYPLPKMTGSTELQEQGATYDKARSGIMKMMQVGLTRTYNLFHARGLTPADVAKASRAPDLDADAAHAAILALRQRHVEMDNAVLKAYGWDTEVDLAHDFYEVDYLPENDNVRFTISPAARRDILQRLLKLNHERHAEEAAAGLHEKKTAKRKVAKKKRATPAKTGPETGDIHVPSEFRYALDPDTYAYRVIQQLLRASGGSAPVRTIARAYAVLSSTDLVGDLAGSAGQEKSVAAWLRGQRQAVDLNAFMPAIRSLIEREFLLWPGQGLAGELRLTGDAAEDESDDWIVADADLALALAAAAPPELSSNPVLQEIERLVAA